MATKHRTSLRRLKSASNPAATLAKPDLAKAPTIESRRVEFRAALMAAENAERAELEAVADALSSLMSRLEAVAASTDRPEVIGTLESALADLASSGVRVGAALRAYELQGGES